VLEGLRSVRYLRISRKEAPHIAGRGNECILLPFWLRVFLVLETEMSQHEAPSGYGWNGSAAIVYSRRCLGIVKTGEA